MQLPLPSLDLAAGVAAKASTSRLRGTGRPSLVVCHALLCAGDTLVALQALWFHVQLLMASLGLAAGLAAEASASRLRGSGRPSLVVCHAVLCAGDMLAALQALWFHVQLPMASLGLAAGVAAEASASRLRGAALLNLLHQRAASVSGALETA